MKENLKYIELCAGIGGFRLGIELSKITAECVYRNEIDEFCEKTYFENFNESFNEKDIFDIDTKKLPDFDFLCAGFPCQPFSIAGNQGGFSDERGQIYFRISQIIKERAPKMIILENVANLINHNKGETFKYILSDLSKLDYHVKYDIIDSRYFGLPQSRPRVYIVALKKHLYREVNYEFPKSNGKSSVLRDIIKSGDNSIPISEKWNTYIDLYTNKITKDDVGFIIPKTRRTLERISKNCDVADCIFQIRSSGIRAFSLDDVYPTFAVSNSGGGAMIPVLSKERRHLSLIEMKRLMGFPDDFIFPVSRTHSIKQLANAVCPPVVAEIMDSLACIINAS